jgi:acyl-CoA synthetase (AMP-forming)/AMP-acid ligase II
LAGMTQSKQRILTPDGCIDLATMDEEGYINIVGRIKDMIIRGGENIYPKVIEEFLYTHKKIKEVSVLEFQMKSTENKSVFDSNA